MIIQEDINYQYRSTENRIDRSSALYQDFYADLFTTIIYIFIRQKAEETSEKKQQTHNNNNKKQLLSIVLRTGRQTDKQTNRGERITCIVIALHELSLIA